MHDLTLRPDALAVDDPDLPNALFTACREVLPHHILHILGQEGVQVQGAVKRERERIAHLVTVHTAVADGQECGSDNGKCNNIERIRQAIYSLNVHTACDNLECSCPDGNKHGQ